MIGDSSDDPLTARAQRLRVVEVAASAYGRLALRPGRDARVEVRLSLHTGGSAGLLDPGGWVPAAHTPGLVASEQMLEGITAMTQAIPGVVGYFHVAG
jgi:serine/threonine-protein kinase